MKLSFYGLFEKVNFLENQDNSIYDAEIKELKNEIKKRLSYVFNDFIRQVPRSVYPYLNGKYDFIINDFASSNKVEVDFEFDPHIEGENKVCYCVTITQGSKTDSWTDSFESSLIENFLLLC